MAGGAGRLLPAPLITAVTLRGGSLGGSKSGDQPRRTGGGGEGRSAGGKEGERVCGWKGGGGSVSDSAGVTAEARRENLNNQEEGKKTGDVPERAE